MLAAGMRSWLVAALAAIAAAIHLVKLVHDTYPRKMPGLDFSSFYVWAWTLRHNIDPYHTFLMPYAARLHVNIGVIAFADYPPTFLLMFEPLTYLTPWAAYWVWCGITLVLLVASLALLIPTTRSVPIATALIVISIAIFYRPLKIHFVFQQAQILVLFLLVMMWRELQKGNDRAAGLWLGIAGLLKVFPLFMMLYLVCMQKWRVLAFTMIVLAAGFAITLAIVGATAFGFFHTVIRHVTPVPGILEAPIVGIDGTIIRIYHRFDPLDSNSVLVLTRNVVEVILELSALAASTLAILRSRENPRRAEYAFGLCIAAMTVCYPNSWSHYMVLLLFPLSQIAYSTFSAETSAIVPTLALIAYFLAEISAVIAHKSFTHDHRELGLWLIEGMFVSTITTYIAAYRLTVDEPVHALDASAVSATGALHSIESCD